MILISSNLVFSNSLSSNLHLEKGCFDTSYAAKSDSMTTVYLMSDYKLGLLGILQGSTMAQAQRFMDKIRSTLTETIVTLIKGKFSKGCGD